jgi:hypothetical protein
LTFVIGISGFFLVTASLAEAKFLTAEEKEYVSVVAMASLCLEFSEMVTLARAVAIRLQRDRPAISNEAGFNYKEIKRALLSPHVLMIILVEFFNGSNVFGLSIFIPSIVNSLGFSPIKSQLLATGPFVCAFFGKQRTFLSLTPSANNEKFQLSFRYSGITHFVLV